MKIGREIHFQSWTFRDSFFSNVSPCCIVHCIYFIHIKLLIFELAQNTENIVFQDQFAYFACFLHVEVMWSDDVCSRFWNVSIWSGSRVQEGFIVNHLFVPSELFMSLYLELSVKMAFSTSSPYRRGRTLGIRTGRSHPCLGWQSENRQLANSISEHKWVSVSVAYFPAVFSNICH